MLHERTRVNSIAEQLVATARGVVFSTVAIVKQIELLRSSSPGDETLALLNLLALAYIVVTAATSLLRRESPRLRLPLLAVDVLLISGLIYVSGGANNEYYLLYYLPVLQAGVRLNLRDAVATATFSTGLYNLIVLVLTNGALTEISVPAPMRSLAFGGSAISMALIFGLLSSGLRKRMQREDEIVRLGQRICSTADFRGSEDTDRSGDADALGAVGPLAASLELTDAAPRAVLEPLAAALGARYAFIQTRNGSETPRLAVALSADGKAVPERVRELAETVAEMGARGGQALVLPDLSQDPALRDFAEAADTLMLVPLSLGSRTLATVVLCDKTPTSISPTSRFEESDLRLACALAPQASLVLDYASLHRSVRSVLRGAVATVAAAIDAKDRYTRGHSERVAFYAAFLARALGLPQRTVEAVELGALLHDVGKIGMDETLLVGKDALDRADWELVRQHPELGNDIFAHMDALSFLLPALRHHHERYDGTGYPDGLAGDEIPLLARIIAVADAFDAMTFERSYRPQPLSAEEACAEIMAGAGTQFDPELARVFAERATPELQYQAVQLARRKMSQTRSAVRHR
jgi:HD-GYP domain-containing protein (c-di-GMP phosphodiesterase class II)